MKCAKHRDTLLLIDLVGTFALSVSSSILSILSISVAKSAKLFKSATAKRDLKKHLTFGRGLRLKSCEQHSATERRG